MKRLLPLIMATCLLAGCKTKGPDFIAPPPSPSADYGTNGGGQAVLAHGPDMDWWRSFGSAELDTFVTRALRTNHSLAASRATLEKARTRIAAAAGRKLPQVEGNAGAQYQRFNLSTFGFDGAFGGQSFGNPEFDLYNLGLGVSYDLDLFGRNKRAVEQAMAEAEMQQRETEAAHLIVAGRVVAQYLAIAALNDRMAAERALISEDEHNLELTRKRQRGGEGTMVEVLSAQSQLAQDRTSLPGLEQQIAEARAMLAVLIGISPGELEATGFSLERLALPGAIPVALPSELVHRRPDILAAESRLHAAVAAIGVAEAQIYPNISIGASLSQSAGTPEKVFNGSSMAFDLFSRLTAPLFDGGRLKAEKRDAEAQARAEASRYQQVVVEAFGQVSTQLAALETDARALAAQQEAVAIAARSLHLSRRSFEVGNSGILQVLDASRAHQRARLALLNVQAHHYQNVARLYVATAGGWHA